MLGSLRGRADVSVKSRPQTGAGDRGAAPVRGRTTDRLWVGAAATGKPASGSSSRNGAEKERKEPVPKRSVTFVLLFVSTCGRTGAAQTEPDRTTDRRQG